MNPSKNDVTGDFIITGASTKAYASGWDLIWGNKKDATEEEKSSEVTKQEDKTKEEK